MIRSLFVAPGMTLGTPKGTQVVGSQRIPDGTFDADTVARYIKKGYIVELDPAPVQQQLTPILPEGKTSTSVPRPTKGKWDFRLADIKNDKLDVLNMKAADHAKASNLPAIEPFEDVKEALAFMTMDA